MREAKKEEIAILFRYDYFSTNRSNMKNEFNILTFKLPLTIHYQNLLSRKNKYVAQKLFGWKQNVVLAKTNYFGTFI